MSDPTSLNVLIVDDEPSVHGVFSRLFAKMGYACEAVATGKEGLERIATRPYDIFLFDKNLPDCGGSDLARAARAAQPNAVIIIVTGYATRDSADALVGVADEYLTKPFELDYVRETVAELVARRRISRPSPVPLVAPQPGRKWVHLVSDQPRELELLTKVCEQLGAHVTSGVSLPATGIPDALVAAAGACTFDVRRGVWAWQAKKKDLPVVLVMDPNSSSDGAAAVALKASLRVPRPVDAAVLRVLLQRTLAERPG